MCTNIVATNIYNMPQSSKENSSCHRVSSKKIPHVWISGTVGCSESMVKAVRNGERSNETTLGQKIEVAEILLEDGVNNLLKEVKRILQF